MKIVSDAILKKQTLKAKKQDMSDLPHNLENEYTKLDRSPQVCIVFQEYSLV